MNFKLYLEKVSADCSTGSGVIPTIGPWAGYKAIRTRHLDEPRNPPDPTQRDEGFDCQAFDAILKGLIRKRPIGLPSGEFAIFWTNSKGTQNAMVKIDKDNKTITFITMIQQSKPMNKYRVRKGTGKIDLGRINEPN